MPNNGQKDYLGWSIFSLICCCCPIGLAALIFSIKTREATNLNDSATAMKHSRRAFSLNIAALVLGIIIIICAVIFHLVAKPRT